MSTKDSSNIPIHPLPKSARIQNVTDMFSEKYGKLPEFYVRVPGRVNLIGEHIDYCGYGVCPMALEQDVLLAVSVEDKPILMLDNIDDCYRYYECDLNNIEIKIGDGAPEWHQYFLCGVKGIFDILPFSSPRNGMRVMVSGTILPNAGLSSSSALVSAAALATAHLNKISLTKEEIANLCAECERYIGTQGGGMDQAIAFLAVEGCAKFIEFAPLRSSDIILPSRAKFVIAHSLAKLNKAATADFNCRVVECRLAAQVLARKHGLFWKDIKKLGQLQQALSVNLNEIISLVQSELHDDVYTKEEITNVLETTEHELNEISLTPNTRHLRTFKLKSRALHVFREALRVEEFYGICANSKDENALMALGELMNQSHESLKTLYECSHRQLDELVELSKEFTLGCRLTGAGWGGCVVALVLPEHIDKYMDDLKEKFYKQYGIKECNSMLFATTSNSGACIYVAQ